MSRIAVFAVVLLTALVGFTAVTLWYLGSYQGSGSSFGGMMGQMMGSGSAGMTYEMPTSVWTLVIILVAVAVLGLVGVGYYVAFPELRSQEARAGPREMAASPGMSWDVLMRTSKPEEKKVLEVLAAHGGGYLQKFVVREAGLSRLKTHRIVARLAERGVVEVERSGNTNRVTLAPWVREGANPPE